jgi:hypothetical protein
VVYKHSRIKQYLKDGRALRIETVSNDAYDLGCQRLLPNLDDLQAKARATNQRPLDTERVGQGTVLASPAFARIAQSTVTDDGRRAPALRFGDPRVQALTRRPGQHAVRRHRHHQQAPARLDGRTARRPLQHEPGQLRPGPATPQRPDHPHPRPQPLRPDPDGIGFAVFYTKVHDRILTPCLPPAANPTRPPNCAPPSAPSSTRSTSASPTPGCAPQPNRHPQTHDNCPNRPTKGSLGAPLCAPCQEEHQKGHQAEQQQEFEQQLSALKPFLDERLILADEVVRVHGH